MRRSFKSLQVVMLAAVVAVVSAAPAFAKCTRLAFSVNDYGKVEPAKDAKRLLDKYIADWTGERGISGYRTGRKSVKCELFLDFVVFDEYTCRAEATVCWGGSTPEGGAVSSSGTVAGDVDPEPRKVEARSPEPAAAAPAPPAAPAAPHSSDGRYVSDR